MKRFGAIFVATWLVLFALPLAAHEMTIAEMELRESAPGEFVWSWTATSDARAVELDLTPQWPDRCHAEDKLVHCGPGGLAGQFAVNGVGKRYSAVMVKVDWLGGRTRVYTLTGNTPSVRLYASADDNRGIGEIARAYTVLGVEHILTGYDHLAFVLGLLFLVGFRRKLVWTITAFTAAHSLTLAGALKEIGLPQAHLPIALLTFNVGVEMGQLLTVAACYGIYCLLPRNTAWLPGARMAALYVIGSLAAFWSWSRLAVIVANLHT
jgi:hypothetical protein